MSTATTVTYESGVLSVRRRLPVWLLLACTSVWLAEVTATSSRFPFLSAAGWVLLVPLYGLHALLGGWLVMRANRVTWPLLYLPGMLFGVYEAYITKVVWDPTWSKAEWHWQAGGLYLAQTAILVLFWHPVFAFILPLALTERAVTGSSEVVAVLPRPLRWLVGSRWGIVVLGAVAGADSAVGASWSVALGSAASSVAFVLVVREVAARFGPVPSLRAVLPSNRQAASLGGLLLLGYFVLGFGMRHDSLPPVLPGQLTVWVVYAVVVGLYLLALCRARTLPFVLAAPYEKPDRRPLLVLGVAFTVGALLAGIAQVSFVPAFVVLVVGTMTCAVWFAGVVVRTLARPTPDP